MSKTKRKRYSAEFKAKVALEAIISEHTLSELATRYDLYPNMITNWKRQVIENMVETFSTRPSASPPTPAKPRSRNSTPRSGS